MNTPRVSLDQWRTLQAVIDYGGYAQAAEKLHRSQSSVSYAVNKLQTQLGIKLLHIQGRKAILSEAGKILLKRSRQLIADASAIEQLARHLEQGWEAEIRLAVEAAYPKQLIVDALKQFEPQAKHTRIRLEEVVLSGAEEILLECKADLAITPFIPQGFLGEELIQVQFIAVAHPGHALHHLGRKLNIQDLNRETHVIVSDSGSKGIDSGWISDSHRWTVSSPASAHKIISNGLGFGWLAEKEIEQQLLNNELKPLPLIQGQRNTATLYLVYADLDQTGPATRQLAEILKQVST
ncbi:MAG: LysR family transcriptional regulator [Gammaproteobacteria bacterium]|nr:LysR family transcriptional regulator [Gammaproteobacteria bacterium]